MDNLEPWYRLGFITPHLFVDNVPYQFYRLAPPGMMLVTANLDLADYTVEAKAMDGRLPVLNVVREEWSEPAVAWMKANVPHSETFVFKGHMHFWSEPKVFNRAVDAFLAKVR